MQIKRTKTTFVCHNCGEVFMKWQGQCAACGEWNSIEETSHTPPKPPSGRPSGGFFHEKHSAYLHEIDPKDLVRIPTGNKELDRVLGGGLVSSELLLLGGHPGAGKSTLLLEMLASFAKTKKTLYISGEESLDQIAMRAERMGLKDAPILLVSETSMEAISDWVLREKPDLMVVDSIQVMESAQSASPSGSISQVRACAGELMRLAKSQNVIIWMVGHVTKEGQLAGPKVLEHAVDCSLLLESIEDVRFRLLRAMKNRFGDVGEMGVFQMSATGLRALSNPSALFLSDESVKTGSVITPIREGSRSLMIELQSLVDKSEASMPRRLMVGFDAPRASMLMAVCHRYAQVGFGDSDVFFNVVSGMKIMETAADLAFVSALYSAKLLRVLPRNLIVFGEVGLSGEIRAVPYGVERVHEAIKHGFTQIILPVKNMPKTKPKGATLMGVSRIEEALKALPFVGESS